MCIYSGDSANCYMIHSCVYILMSHYHLANNMDIIHILDLNQHLFYFVYEKILLIIYANFIFTYKFGNQQLRLNGTKYIVETMNKI